MNIETLAGLFQQSICHLPPEEVKLIENGKPAEIAVASTIVQDAVSTYRLLNGSERGKKLAFSAMQAARGGLK